MTAATVATAATVVRAAIARFLQKQQQKRGLSYYTRYTNSWDVPNIIGGEGTQYRLCYTADDSGVPTETAAEEEEALCSKFTLTAGVQAAVAFST